MDSAAVQIYTLKLKKNTESIGHEIGVCMIASVDYDAGNLKSVEKALAYLQEESVITRDFKESEKADKVILPGVGSFGAAMDNLKKYELDKVVKEVTASGKPFLGICLGLLLFNGSEERRRGRTLESLMVTF